MRRLAILNPTNLLGRELRERLEARPELWDEMILLATEEGEAGTLTELKGQPVLVREAEAGALTDVDLVFACGSLEASRPILEGRPAGTTAVVLSPEAGPDDGVPLVPPLSSGLDPDHTASLRGQVLLSPHPAAVALTHLLHPFTAGGAFEPRLTAAAATAVLPVSLGGEEPLDALFDQTRGIIAMSGASHGDSPFGRQLAFNLYPDGAAPDLAGLTRQLLGVEGDAETPALAVEALQGAVFHGVSLSVQLRFAEAPDLAQLGRALAAVPGVSLSPEAGDGDWDGDDEPRDIPGPVEAAAEEALLVGRLRAEASDPRSVWAWAVMDNLTRGGALNALGILEQLAAS